jgi:hypothetical protein
MTPEHIPADLADLEALMVTEQSHEGLAFADSISCPYGCRVGVFRTGWTVADPLRGGWQVPHERNCPSRLEDDNEP